MRTRLAIILGSVLIATVARAERFDCPPPGLTLKLSTGALLRYDGRDGLWCQRSLNGKPFASDLGHVTFYYRDRTHGGEEYGKWLDAVDELWPIAPGKSASFEFQGVSSGGGEGARRDSQTYAHDVTVESSRQITVAAGTFTVYPIVDTLRGMRSNTHVSTRTYYYAPELHAIVKFEFHLVVGSLADQPKPWEVVAVIPPGGAAPAVAGIPPKGAEPAVAVIPPKVAAPAGLDLPVGVNIPVLLGDTRPREVLASFTATMTFDSRNAGYNGQRQFSLALDDTGLWQVDETITRANGGSGGAQQLSLCGLAMLQYDSRVVTPTEMSNPVLLGRIFIPLTVTRPVKSVTRWQVTSFTTTAKHICMPEPGETFTYHFELDVKQAPGKQESVEDVTCHVDAEVRPANQFAASLRGDALAVSCERTHPTIGVIKTEFAFLRDSAFYLVLQSTLGQKMTVTTRYDAATYRP